MSMWEARSSSIKLICKHDVDSRGMRNEALSWFVISTRGLSMFWLGCLAATFCNEATFVLHLSFYVPTQNADFSISRCARCNKKWKQTTCCLPTLRQACSPFYDTTGGEILQYRCGSGLINYTSCSSRYQVLSNVVRQLLKGYLRVFEIIFIRLWQQPCHSLINYLLLL